MRFPSTAEEYRHLRLWPQKTVVHTLGTQHTLVMRPRARKPASGRGGRQVYTGSPSQGSSPSAHDRQRCLGPAALGDVPGFPLSPAARTARWRSAAAKNMAWTSRRPHSDMHSSLRCNQGARLDGVCPRPSLPHGWTHGLHPEISPSKRGPTACGPGWPPDSRPEPDLRPLHHPRTLWE